MLIGSCKSALLSPSPVFEVQDTLSNEQVLAVLLVVEEADFEIRPKPRSRRARRRSARGYGLRRLRVMLDISRKGFWGVSSIVYNKDGREYTTNYSVIVNDPFEASFSAEAAAAPAD